MQSAYNFFSLEVFMLKKIIVGVLFFLNAAYASLTFTGTNPNFYTDDGPPISTYLPLIVNDGQFYINRLNHDMWVCVDNSDQNNLQWGRVPRNDQVSEALNLIQTGVSRSLNSAFQVSATRNALVNYSIDISCVLSLTSGQSGNLFLEIASDSGFTMNVQEITRLAVGTGGSLTIGLNLTQNCTGTVTGFIPASYYVRLRTANAIGSPVFTYRTGQEILF